jgi:two-component system, cell cycle sensor histidine kinase and response regulator CckA
LLLLKRSAPVQSDTAVNPITILVVDDEPMVVDLVHTMLWREGFEILEAFDGTQALTIAQQTSRRVDLLLTDIVMPGMNGLQLAKEMKSRIPDLRVLYMSGYLDEAISEITGTAVEGSSVLRKPFKKFGLVSKVREMLDGRTISQAAAS